MTVAVASPIAWADVEAALIAWAQGVCPELTAVIFGRQNGPQPDRPYVVLDTVSLAQLGSDDIRYEFVAINPPLEQHKVTIAGQRRWALSVNVIAATGGPSAHALSFAERLRTSLALPGVLDPLLAEEISVIDAGDVQDLTALEDTEWVSRAQFDLTLGLAANTEPAAAKEPIIDSTEVEGPENLPVHDQTQITEGNNP